MTKRENVIAVLNHGHPATGRWGAVLYRPATGAVVFAAGAEEFGDIIAAEFIRGAGVILATEAPTSMIPGSYSVERPYELRYSRPWWKDSGRVGLTLYLAQLPATLGAAMKAVAGVKTITATAQPAVWQSGNADLLLIEALTVGWMRTAVPGNANITPDQWDALCVAITVGHMIEEQDISSNVIGASNPHGAGVDVINLSAAIATWAGCHVNQADLHTPPVVISPLRDVYEEAANLAFNAVSTQYAA